MVRQSMSSDVVVVSIMVIIYIYIYISFYFPIMIYIYFPKKNIIKYLLKWSITHTTL